MAIGQNFYPDQEFADIENLSRGQSRQALAYGDQAARYADPFMAERGKYQKQLSDLMANPGSFASSPTYQFAYDQGLNALQRKGGVRSGAKMAELERYGQGMASQQFNTQAKLLSDLAMSGSSPASAGLSYARGADRSQDYAQMAAAAKGAGAANKQQGSQNQTPWWMQNTGGAPSGGSSGGGSGGGADYGYGSSYGGQYFPVSSAGTGSITSNYGTYDFGTPARGDSYYTPSSGYSDLGSLGGYGGNTGYSDDDWNYAFDDSYGGDYGDYSGDYGY